MQIRDGIVEAIGNTPLIKLQRVSEETGCTILGNAELMNPGQSVQDRAGRELGPTPPIIEDIKCEKAYLIPDEEAIPYIFDLLEHEGLCLGGSSAINIAGAVRLAKDLGPGKTIVTLLCDSGTRYQSKLYNPDFLRSKNLPVPEWLERKSNVKPPFV